MDIVCVSVRLAVIVCIVDIAIVTVRAVTIVAHAHNSINRKVSKDSEFPRVCIFDIHFVFSIVLSLSGKYVTWYLINDSTNHRVEFLPCGLLVSAIARMRSERREVAIVRRSKI